MTEMTEMPLLPKLVQIYRCFTTRRYTRNLQRSPEVEVEVEQCLMSHQTHYMSYRGRVFRDHMIQPTVDTVAEYKRPLRAAGGW